MDEQREPMMQTAVGYWLSKALYCAARAEVADALRDGPQPAAELARSAGVDPENRHRLLRALASVGIFAESEAGEFALTPKATTPRA